MLYYYNYETGERTWVQPEHSTKHNEDTCSGVDQPKVKTGVEVGAGKLLESKIDQMASSDSYIQKTNPSDNDDERYKREEELYRERLESEWRRRRTMRTIAAEQEWQQKLIEREEKWKKKVSVYIGRSVTFF